MAFENRQPRDYLFGTLTTAVALSDTALASASFVGLPSNYSGATYLPLVLHDPSTGVYEVVWVTGHAGASATVTAARGREGTAARSWPAGTQLVCAPTIRDGLFWVPTRSALPTDAHTGMRVEIADEGVTVRKLTTGWLTESAIRFYAAMTGQSVGSGAWLPISFTTGEVKDTANGHSTSVNPSRYVIPVSGSYELTGALEAAANASGSRGCGYRSNGVGTSYDQFTHSLLPATPAGSHAQPARTVQADYVAGDYVEFVVWQNSGIALSYGASFGVKYLGSD